MYKIDGLTNYANVYGQNLADAQALPQNTTWTGPAVKLAGTLGGIEVVVRAHSALALADTKTLTVKLRHAGADLAYADLATVYAATAAAGSGAKPKNAELARFVLPSNVKANVLATVTTDDAAATGTLDIIPTYLPR
jgi:hypothetical protein